MSDRLDELLQLPLLGLEQARDAAEPVDRQLRQGVRPERREREADRAGEILESVCEIDHEDEQGRHEQDDDDQIHTLVVEAPTPATTASQLNGDRQRESGVEQAEYGQRRILGDRDRGHDAEVHGRLQPCGELGAHQDPERAQGSRRPMIDPRPQALSQ